MPLLPALFCSPHGILAISVGGKRIGPVDPKPFIDQLKSPEAPCLRISVVLHVLIMYSIYLLVRLRGVFLQDDGASAFRGPLPHRHMLMYISEDDEGAPPFSRVGNTPPCDPLPAGSQHQETPRFPFGGPWRGPCPRLCSYHRAGVSLQEEGSRRSPGADGAPHQGRSRTLLAEVDLSTPLWLP